MVDRGFKTKTNLALQQCTLDIPPSANQATSVTNVRIYVEHAIKIMKDCRILKNEIQLLYLAIADDIIKVCVALNNLKKKLVG